MSTNVIMPQMGESVAEGTVVRWIKKVGESVDRDEPLFEISTDKVDAEIPSPAAGVLAEIRVKEGETVPVDSVVAIIAPPGEAPAARPAGAAAGTAAVQAKPRSAAGKASAAKAPAAPSAAADGDSRPAAVPQPPAASRTAKRASVETPDVVD